MKWVTNSYWILFTGRPGEHQPAVGGISPQWDLVSMVTSSIWIEMIIIVKVKHQSFLLFIIQHCLPYLSPNCTVVELLKLGGWEVSDKHILPHLIWYKNLIAYDLNKKKWVLAIQFTGTCNIFNNDLIPMILYWQVYCEILLHHANLLLDSLFPRALFPESEKG